MQFTNDFYFIFRATVRARLVKCDNRLGILQYYSDCDFRLVGRVFPPLYTLPQPHFFPRIFTLLFTAVFPGILQFLRQSQFYELSSSSGSRFAELYHSSDGANSTQKHCLFFQEHCRCKNLNPYCSKAVA